MNATRLFVAGIALTALIVGDACAGDEASDTKRVKVGSVTMENLQKTFNGESNAEARYEAFAKKADEEGYLGVAGLFRAAAKAEAEKNAEIARAFRGTAKVDGTHAAIYTATLAKMEELKAKTDYALCPVCGFVTTAAEEMKKCPVCSESRKKFETVN